MLRRSEVHIETKCQRGAELAADLKMSPTQVHPSGPVSLMTLRDEPLETPLSAPHPLLFHPKHAFVWGHLVPMYNQLKYENKSFIITNIIVVIIIVI